MKYRCVFLAVVALMLTWSMNVNALDLDDAHEQAAAILADDTYWDILLTLQTDERIDWREERERKWLHELEKHGYSRGKGQDNVSFMRQVYESKGLTQLDGYKVRKGMLRCSDAKTPTCSAFDQKKVNTYIHERKFRNRSHGYLVATLIHEQTHALCHVHGKNQQREHNRCDLGYVMGTLGEMMYEYKKSSDEPVSLSSLDSEYPCEALVEELRARRILE